MTSARSEPGELGGARGDHRDKHHGCLHFLSTVALSSCLSGLITTFLTKYVYSSKTLSSWSIGHVFERIVLTHPFSPSTQSSQSAGASQT